MHGWRRNVVVAVALSAGVALAAPALAEPSPTPPAAPSPVDGLLGEVPPVGALRSSDFYQVPAELPAGSKPGDVIKQEPIALPTLPNAKVTRIMYVSTDQQGDLVPVTGAVLSPMVSPLAAGSDSENAPMVALTPGTRGLGDHCAPSQFFDPETVDPRQPDYEVASYTNYLARGISVAITDYLGGGTELDQEYLVGRSEGQNSLDVARAAQQVDTEDGLNAESPVGLSGYSQGGQAASWAAEIQPDYAPDLNLKGALVDAPPFDMQAQFDHLNGNPTGGAGVALAAVTGIDAAFPGMDLTQYETDLGKKAFARVRQSCVLEELGGFGTTTVGDATNPDVSQMPEFRAALAESLLGTKAPEVPAYIYQGTTDTVVPPNFGRNLYNAWCGQGASSVEFTPLPAQEHLSGNVTGTPAAISWMADRLAGKPAQDGCREGQQLPGIG